jgi:uncharacterized repeat protein (TIGR01451 family)
MDETSGSVAQDIVSSMDGNIQLHSSSGGFIQGKVDGGYHYEHQDNNIDRVTVPHDTNLNFGTGSFTIDAWVAFPLIQGKQKTASGASGVLAPQGAMILKKQSSKAPYRGFSLIVEHNTHLYARLSFGGSNSASFRTANPVSELDTGDWTHLAVRFDRNGTQTYTTFFVNGSPVPSQQTQPVTTTSNASVDNPGDAVLGWVGESFKQMYLDEVEVFNRALTDPEIQAIYAAGSAGKCKPLPQPVDIKVEKAVDTVNPGTGDIVHYTITVTNIGSIPATGIVVTDSLPSGMVYVGHSGPGAYDGSEIWTIGSLGPTGQAVLTIEVTVTGACGQTITNTATVTALDQFDLDTTNNSDSVSVTVEPCGPPPCPVGLLGIAPGSPGSVGPVILYDIDPVTGAATNPRSAGVGHSAGIDFGPNGKLYAITTFASTGSDNNALYEIDPTTGSATRIGTLPNGLNIGPISEGDLAFDPNGVLYGIGASQSGQPALFIVDLATGIGTIVGVIPGINVDISSIAFDLSGRLFAINNTISAGTSTFLLELDPVDGKIITTTTLGTNLGGISGMDSDDYSGTFYVVDGANSGNDQLYTLDVGSGTLTPASSPTGVTGGFSGLVVTPCVSVPVDIEVVKTVSDSSPTAGDVISYNIVVTNLSKNPATGIVVTDLLPGGVTIVSATASTGPGTYNDTTGVWTLGSLPKFTRVNLYIEFTVDSDACGQTITNTATLTALDQEDTNPGNNSSTVDIVVAPCPPTCPAPVTTTFTAGVPDIFSPTANAPELSSPSTALQAYMAPYTAGSQDFDGTIFNRVFGHTFTDLPPVIVGTSLEINLKVIGSQESDNDGISLAMTGTNTFAWGSRISTVAGVPWITGASEVITLELDSLPDGTPDGTDILSDINSSNTLDVYVQDDTSVDYITLTVVACPVDIEVVKTVSDSSPTAGDVISYNIVVTNLSKKPATGIVVTDLLPGGVTIVSATASTGPGTYNDTTGVWTLGSLPKFTRVNLYIEFTVDSDACGQTITNTATLTALDQEDTNPGNNSSTVDIVVAPCPPTDLELKKHIGKVFRYGQPAAYNIVIQNVGAGDAFSPITFQDTLPNGITYVSFTEPYSSGNWKCKAKGQTVECTYSGPVIGKTGVLPLLIINVKVVGITEFTGGSDAVVNCATVSHKDDKNPANDEGCVNTIITV